MIKNTLPFPTIRCDERRPVAGWFLSSAAWFGLYCFVILVLISIGLLINANANGLLVILLSLALFGVFYVTVFPRVARLIIRGRKMRAPRAVDILSEGRLPLVVLLRSFEDDDLIDPSMAATNQIAPGRYEERIVKALSAVGHAVALGRPSEPDPELGAARLYVEDKYWQDAISYLIEHAAAVVAVVGRSSGLWWEVELALNKISPQKLLFFFPYPASKEVRTSYLRSIYIQNPIWGKWLRRKAGPVMEAEREKRYQVFRERFGTFFKRQLPPTLGGARFLHMDSNGLPQLLDPARPSFQVRLMTMNFRSRMDISFKRELRPFVEKLAALKLVR
jgi:hypothetical protein